MLPALGGNSLFGLLVEDVRRRGIDREHDRIARFERVALAKGAEHPPTGQLSSHEDFSPRRLDQFNGGRRALITACQDPLVGTDAVDRVLAVPCPRAVRKRKARPVRQPRPVR